MPSISLNNIVFTGKMNVVPTIKGATFSVSQVDRQTRDANAELFGTGLGVSSDTIVIGAYGVDAPSTDFGAAHLYSYSNGLSTYVADLTLTGAQISNLTGKQPRFGTSASVSGDWAAVGAPGPGTTTWNGSVYLYRRVNGVWNTTPFQELLPADAGGVAGFNFGYSVALDSTTLVVGHREGINNHGCAHVFVFNGTNWVLQTTLTAPSTRVTTNTGSNGQRMGWSVAISGNTVLVGGPGTASGVGNGQAIVATRTGNAWNTPIVLLPQSPAANDGFGISVAQRGTKYVIGAPGQNSAYLFNGATQVAQLNVAFSGTPTITDPGLTSTASTAASARAGWSVDINSDGTVIAAGAPTQTSTSGTVYVFELLNGTWGPSAINTGGVSKLIPNPSGVQRFGWSVNFIATALVVTATGQPSPAIPGAFYTFK